MRPAGRMRLVILFCLIYSASVHGQPTQSSEPLFIPAKGADSLYVVRNRRTNNIRFTYGAQGNSLIYGSSRDGSPAWQGSIYKNSNDFVGVGLTYKFIDVDMTFSLYSTTYLRESRSNLSQFKLGLSYTRRKFALRVYVVNSEGYVIQGADSNYVTSPSVHEYRIAGQITWISNDKKYSLAAMLYQDEIQRRSAGSFLLRGEPFYRRLGSNNAMAPATYDLRSRFGDQAGLEYIYAPGLLIMPGYAYTWSWQDGKYFVSPFVCAGPGLAFNTYKGLIGERNYVSVEYGANAMITAGFNDKKWFGRIQINGTAGYIPLKPSYFTNAQLIITIVAGFRFKNLEKFLPG